MNFEFRHIAVAAIAIATTAYVAYSEREMRKSQSEIDKLLKDHEEFMNRA